MNSDSKNALILLSAGSSSRMGGRKKEYLPLEKGTVLSECAKKFLDTDFFSVIVVVVPKNDEENAKNALFADSSIHEKLNSAQIFYTTGGSTRQQSVFNGLKLLATLNTPISVVLIHDGARPFVNTETIKETLFAAQKFGAAVPGLTPVDTQKTVDKDGFILQHLQRSSMVAVQTPQGFDFQKLLQAHKKAQNDKNEYTDDTEIWEKYIGKVKVTKGNPENKKITFPKDYEKKEMNISTIRTGLGYDLHRLKEGRKLLLGGVEFDFEKGEDGHSDGDVLLHAITDALLGASSMSDIGSFFPPEDSKWKDADSKVLLATVWNKIKEKNWQLENLDCVIKLEKPKFLPKRNEVISSIAKILDVNEDKIFVKAKTGEKLGDVGKSEAVEVWCTCLLSKS